MQLKILAAILILVAMLAGSARSQDSDPDMLAVEVKEESDINLLINRLNGDEPKAQEQALGNLTYCGRTAWPAALALAHVVDTSTAQNKLWALERLADLECEAVPAIAAISRALRDRDPLVRAKAGYCLLRINAGDREAACRALSDRLLGEIGPEAKAAIPTLIDALVHKRPIVRLAAIHALSGMGTEARPAIEGLGKCLCEAQPFSMPMAHHDFCVSDEAAVALQQIGLLSTDTLLRALANKESRVRVNAAKALGNLPDPQGRITVALTKLLDDPEPWIRGAAVDALGKLGGELAFRALSSRLNDAGGWTSYPSAAGGIGTGQPRQGLKSCPRAQQGTA
jgi:HEAT repeats